MIKIVSGSELICLGIDNDGAYGVFTWWVDML